MGGENNKMGDDTFKNTLFGFILISLFGMLLLGAVLEVGEEYSMDTSEISGGVLSLDKFNESISSVESNAKDLNERFEKGSIWSVVAGVVVEGIFGIAKDMITMILLPFDILIDIMSNVFGVPAYVTSTLLGLIIMGIIFSIWSLLKIGR